jgi:iron complex outermembrane receptor protein
LANASAAALTLVAAPAWAQSSTTAQSDQLQVIVVTAQRRAEKAQEVPMTVTVLTNKELVNAQVDTVEGLARLTPSMVNYESKGDPYALAFSLRGVPVQGLNINVDPTVGTYIDGVYLARQDGAGLGLVDMARTEVLSGPQGTLFGRNTIGGALNLTTQEPTDKFGGYATVDLGNYDARNLLGVVNVPIVDDRLDARLVYDHQEHSGFSRDLHLNQDQNNLNSNFVRASIKARLNEAWTLHVTGDYVRYTANSQEMPSPGASHRFCHFSTATRQAVSRAMSTETCTTPMTSSILRTLARIGGRRRR